MKSLNEHVALQNIYYYNWKDIRKQYTNNKLKIIAATWNDEFELPDGFIPFQIFKMILNMSLQSMKH